MDKTNLILETIDQDITVCHALASHWEAMAITGAAKNRKLFHGINGPEFTDEEKIDDAMTTASTHLGNMFELVEEKKRLLSDNDEQKK